MGGSSCAITVVTGAVGSSTGWTSAYWSAQKLSLRLQVTGWTASSRDRSSA